MSATPGPSEKTTAFERTANDAVARFGRRPCLIGEGGGPPPHRPPRLLSAGTH